MRRAAVTGREWAAESGWLEELDVGRRHGTQGCQFSDLCDCIDDNITF